MSKSDPGVHLMRAHDVLGEALDLVEGIGLAGLALETSSDERRSITFIASLASTRIRKAQRRIERYCDAQRAEAAQ
jgi:hypothetical protein